MEFDFSVYKKEMLNELDSILSYWLRNTIDDAGGFIGQIDQHNVANKMSPKGSVLNCRILWTFAAAYNYQPKPELLEAAKRSYDYLLRYFIDKINGGVYWTVDHQGNSLDTKKQIYAQAFALYALSEFYKCVKDETIKMQAIELFHVIEKRSYDPIHGGYIDAFSIDWQPMTDIRLSAKDANEKKTMNTHLHIMEAYSNLYRIWPGEELRAKIAGLIKNFLQHFIDEKSNHLLLFFNDSWENKPGPVSYGHDIEAAWLILEAAELIQDPELIKAAKQKSISIANAAMEGIDKDGGLWYETEHGQLVKEKHWWPQAEAMVGLLNAYQESRNEIFLQTSWQCWKFTKSFIRDREFGEWHWGVDSNLQPMKGQDKVGLWKCPYHNARACIEVARRLDDLILELT